MYNKHYGFLREDAPILHDPDWWDKLTGMDWGTDRCLRNGYEAYVCYSHILESATYHNGWDQQAVQYLIEKSFPYRTGDSAEFWKAVQLGFMKWVKETGFIISDFPNWKQVLKVMDSATSGAFSYRETKKNADAIFEKTAITLIVTGKLVSN